MSKRQGAEGKKSGVSRRDFVRTGGAVLAGGAALGGAAIPAGAETRPGGREPGATLFPNPQGQDARIQAFRTLGRTGFQVSDIGMGSVPLRETSVVRYAYDKGINYFDTAEGYGNGAAERAIGEAMQHMDRDKIFIATKAVVREGDDAEAVVQKVRQSLERLQTDYVDAYSMHATSTVAGLSHPGFHEAMDLLKAEGRVRFRGVSYHGPGRGTDEPTADVLTAAAEDGRFDMMLLVYNFMNHEDGDRILAACKANNVGTTAMKTAPGSISYEPVDPENLSEIGDLLGEEELTSADYNTIRALVKGEINTFMGFTFHRSQRLTVDASDIRTCFAWAQDGLLLGLGADIHTRISERADKNYLTQVWCAMTIGATRMEEAKVVEVSCDETPD